MKNITIIAGSYTEVGETEGISIINFDPNTAEFTLIEKIISGTNPSFLSVATDKKTLYCVNENDNGNGSISAFELDIEGRKISMINSLITQGDHPCHVLVEPTNSHLFVSNYTGGSLSVFSLEKQTGAVGKLVQLIKYEGSSVHPERQQQSHIHSAALSSDGKYLFVMDLGTDKITTYKFDKDAIDYPLNIDHSNTFVSPAGSGPRLMAVANCGSFTYAVNELSAEISVFENNDGKINKIQQLPITEKGFNGESCAAHIEISDDGKYLYASNRGDANDICVFRIHPETGTLTQLENYSCCGRGPRNFTLSPNHDFLFVANQYSNDIVAFARNKATGALTSMLSKIKIPSPVCLLAI